MGCELPSYIRAPPTACTSSRWWLVGRGWGKAGSRRQGLKKDSGVRIQDSGVRTKNIGPPFLPSTQCRPPTALGRSSSWRDSWPVPQSTTRCHRRQENQRLGTLKVSDQYGNVYENKGPALSSPASSGNVYENKGSYALKTGMLLKIKVVGRWWVVG
jgi:hypothetical protein